LHGVGRVFDLAKYLGRADDAGQDATQDCRTGNETSGECFQGSMLPSPEVKYPGRFAAVCRYSKSERPKDMLRTPWLPCGGYRTTYENLDGGSTLPGPWKYPTIGETGKRNTG
jgi:hypothetical protein